MIDTPVTTIPFFLEYLRDQLYSKSLDGEVYGNHILHLLDYPPIDSHEPITFLVDSGFEENEAIIFWESLQKIAKNGSLSNEQIDCLCDGGILTKQYDDTTSTYQLYLTNQVDSNTSILSNTTTKDTDINEEEDEIIIEQEMDWMYYVDQIETTLLQSYECTQEFSSEAIYFALYKTNYDILLSTQLLLYNMQLLDACKPCRHYLQQTCYRKDCMFEHHLENYPCRFWLYSHCTNISPTDTSNTAGTKCLFAHDLMYFDEAYLQQYYASLLTATSAATFASSQSQQSMDEWPAMSKENDPKAVTAEQFPSLAQSTASNKANHSKKKKATTTEKKDTTPAYKAAVQTAVKTTDADMNVINTAIATSSSSSSRQVGVSTKNTGFGDILSQHQFILLSSKNNQGSGGKSNAGIYRLKSDPSEWVSSGDTLRHDYETLRQEARDYAISRNKLLQEASIAFLSGAKDIARSLSKQGQLLNQHMKECHIQAAKAIFRKRNSLPNLQQGRIDVHGLHVQEAIDCLKELIPLYQQYGHQQIRIVTGSGHHTKGPQEGKARLHPAVTALLEEDYRFRIKDIKDASGYVGGIVVEI